MTIRQHFGVKKCVERALTQCMYDHKLKTEVKHSVPQKNVH
jgi:hypothetical protein